MNWDIFRGMVKFYKEKGQDEKVMELMKEWNVIDQNATLRRD